MSKTITRVRTLREEFDWLLSQLGVSCFTLFAEDLWQPLVLVPQEVDTALYYPEATYAGPDDAAVNRIESEIAAQQVSAGARVPGVVGAFFQDAQSSPLRRVATPPAHPEAFKPLYSGFVDREQIQSSAVFMPEIKPRLENNTKKEVLFLNFRKKTEFTDELKVRLRHLAGKMLDRVPIQVNDRNRGAYAPARTMIRAFTSLLREMNNQLNDPSRRFDEPFFNTIATRLCDVLLRKRKAEDQAASATQVSTSPGPTVESAPGAGSQPPMIVSIYLCVSSEGEPVPGASPSRNDLGRHQVLNVIGSSSMRHLRPTQKLYDTGSSSVTICSATTGGTLMLPRIDPFWDPPEDQGVRADGSSDGQSMPPQEGRRTVETSLELISFQMYLAQSLLASGLLPTGKTGPTGAESKFGFSVEEIREGSNGPCARLIIHTPYPGTSSGTPDERRARDALWESKCDELRKVLLDSELGKRWPDLAKKAQHRMNCQYAHIFGALDKDWELPSAEVCVPIRFAGQTIGCVNIESKQTDYFPPTVIGLLNSLAGIIGTAAARNRDIEMLDCLDNATKAIHSQEYVNEIKTAGGGGGHGHAPVPPARRPLQAVRARQGGRQSVLGRCLHDRPHRAPRRRPDTVSRHVELQLPRKHEMGVAPCQRPGGVGRRELGSRVCGPLGLAVRLDTDSPVLWAVQPPTHSHPDERARSTETGHRPPRGIRAARELAPLDPGSQHGRSRARAGEDHRGPVVLPVDVR